MYEFGVDVEGLLQLFSEEFVGSRELLVALCELGDDFTISGGGQG